MPSGTMDVPSRHLPTSVLHLPYHVSANSIRQAFAASAASDIKFLDMAVACHIKLDDLNPALSLSRKITKHAPKDCRGYLRMGQVLQLQEKPEMALEVYKLGLRRCPSEDPEQLHVCAAHSVLSPPSC